MEPKLQKVGLEGATFQVLRRTNAQLARKADTDDKVAADQRGHGLGVSLPGLTIFACRIAIIRSFTTFR